MARAMGMENPLVPVCGLVAKVQLFGVVKNFHFQSLYTAIEPLIILLSPTRTEYLFVRIAADKRLRRLQVLSGHLRNSMRTVL